MAETTNRLKLQGFSTKGLAGDLSAGLTKSIDSVTGGMANAVLAGVNPVYGLYTVLAATPIGALFTSSVYMNIDSTGAIAATAGSMLLIYPKSSGSALAVLTLPVFCWRRPAETRFTRFISTPCCAASHRHRRQHHPGQQAISPATPANTTKPSKPSTPSFILADRSPFFLGRGHIV
jgi:hypothetical protein